MNDMSRTEIYLQKGASLPMDDNADGSLTCFQGENQVDGVKIISQTAPDATSRTAGWTMLADNGIFAGCIVRDLTPAGHKLA